MPRHTRSNARRPCPRAGNRRRSWRTRSVRRRDHRPEYSYLGSRQPIVIAVAIFAHAALDRLQPDPAAVLRPPLPDLERAPREPRRPAADGLPRQTVPHPERRGGGEGKGGSVSVELGGQRTNKKNKNR